MPDVFSLRLDQVPDPLAVSAALPDLYPYFLDSAAPGPLGRVSLLLRRDESSPVLSLDQGRLQGPGEGDGFLDRLGDWYAAEAVKPSTDEHPFVGGWFLYLGYELVAEIEPTLRLPPSRHPLPTALADRCTGALVIHHDERPWAELVAESPSVLEAMQSEIDGLVTGVGRTAIPLVTRLEPEPPERFEAAVERIHEYLLDGDVFQVNVSRDWTGEFAAEPDPIALYQRLRSANPAPFAGLMRWGGATLMSSSPERLVEVRGRQVQTRPIAGTRPRGSDRHADDRLSEELIGHPKERAEHIMLIDLERNDLGRVCETGSVEVNELMVVESYAHVHHIVSNVRGVLRPDATPVDAIRAVFPGGTITGCPKVRCMEIISELEGQGRGFYTGGMGYLGRDGQMDVDILIRSMLLTGRTISFRTGAGIVADSLPAAEVQETEDKARGMLLALLGGAEEK